MAQLDNMIKWCLDKGKIESEKHKGLKKVSPDKLRADKHIEKAEHYLDATLYLKEGEYTDIAVSTVFYSMYHCLLALLAKHGYESRNQKCTFACVEDLITKGVINLDIAWVKKIADYDESNSSEDIITLREEFQYGTETNVNTEKLNSIIEEAKKFREVVRQILVKEEK